ncbi:linearmycin resistance ATP-binding protein LnrL [Deinococcus xinjiangensis]|uniref:Linearmycin resistance ATP-binding protein LnrL n=1 Tax=Deinococcus xinjiangensis TaxID=457454 RepID=A0ABP9VBZ8_9DEIO
MNGIELQNVSKTYGKVTALHDLSLDIRAGELTALLGPNGAGKTTAISLMLGLAAPTQGQVRVLGGNPKDDAVRTQIGSMPQESAIPAALTVREAAELFASFYPAPLRADEALALADLQSVAHRRAGALSGGQKRRLAFALAVVGNPEILLIDEPTTGMDAQSRLAFWAAMESLKAAGRTILLTTHYLEEAERTAERVVVMNAGTILADGTPESLRSQVGGSTVRFKSDLVLAELQSLPTVERAQVDPQGRAELHTAAPEALLGELFRRQIPFSELEVTRASLEDAFLRLTDTEQGVKA